MIIRAAAPFFYILHFIFLHVYVEIIVQIARQCIQSKLLFFSNKAFNCLKNTHSTSTQTFKSERKFVRTILQTTSCNSLSFSTSCKIWRYYSSECRFDKAIIKSSSLSLQRISSRDASICQLLRADLADGASKCFEGGIRKRI